MAAGCGCGGVLNRRAKDGGGVIEFGADERGRRFKDEITEEHFFFAGATTH